VHDHPLRVGLSMDAKVDVADTSGGVLAAATQHPARAQTSVFDRGSDQAEAEVQKIIAANLGRRVGDAAHPATAAAAGARGAAPTIARTASSNAAR